MTEAQWLALLARSHEVVSRVEVWHNGKRQPRALTVIDGSVDVDGTASVRRKFNCEVMVKRGQLLPTTPGVTELRPFRGIRHRGEEKLWPLGRFRVSSDGVTQTRENLSYKIDAYDISRTLTVNRLYEPMTVLAGTPVEQVIVALLGRAVSGLEYVFPEESIGSCPALLFEEGDAPWTAAEKLASQYGFSLFADVEGRITAKAAAPLDAGGVRVIGARELLEVSNERDNEPGYNGIKVVSETNDSPATFAYVWDDDPNSPTYWRGDYGRRVRFYKTTIPMTQLQVDLVAQRQYARTIGGTTQAKFVTFVDPTLEVGDVLAIKAADVNIENRYVAEAFSIPLSFEGDMDVTTTKRRNGMLATDLPEAM